MNKPNCIKVWVHKCGVFLCSCKSDKPDIVQVLNPKTGLYIKIDRSIGKIISYKKTKGKYKNIKVARRKRKGDEC